jgi:septum formation protein
VSALPRLVLASQSPRRADLLRAAGFDFEVRVADVDESVLPGESPHDYVSRLAIAKAVAARRADDDLVLAADTTVVVDGHVLGKPADAADASRMLRRLAGREHDVLTGVCLLRGRYRDTRVAATRVGFLPMTDDEIAWYVASGEPMDKAGAYGIQGRVSRFVTGITGSYSNVVGLPVALVYQMVCGLPARGRPEDGTRP